MSRGGDRAGSLFANAISTVQATEPRLLSGSVHALRGLTLVVDRLRVPIGSLIDVDVGTATPGMGEVIGFDGPRSLAMLYGSTSGVAPGATVRALRPAPSIAIGRSWLGRTLDALGRPIDDGPPLDDLELRPLDPPTTNPMSRSIIEQPMPTGIRVVDSLLTVGRGQRLGIFAGPGVGKSTLLASIAKGAAADVAIIGLVGERGREVKEFVDQTLGPEGHKRAAVVVAVGDESPLLRVRAATAAIAAAEYFRDQGLDVVLMIDSVTRLAHAQRQIGLAAGEQPATKGYTPSVFSLLPRLLERAGPITGGGSITGFYTVLVEGDDLTEPVSDAVKGILDGHVVLSRRIALRGHFPAVDPLDSLSRVADQVTDENHQKARRELMRVLSAYREHEELLSIGAYIPGSNVDVDIACALREEIATFLQQGRDEREEYPQTLRRLIELSLRIDAARRRPIQVAPPSPIKPAAAPATQAPAPRGR